MACPPGLGKLAAGHHYGAADVRKERPDAGIVSVRLSPVCLLVVRMERRGAWIVGGNGRAAECEAEDYGWNEFIHTAFPFFFGSWASGVVAVSVLNVVFVSLSSHPMGREFFITLFHKDWWGIVTGIRTDFGKNMRPSPLGPGPWIWVALGRDFGHALEEQPMDRSDDDLPVTDSPWLAQGKAAAFSTTHWSVVLTAGQDDLAGAAAALEELCRKYWYPIYAFVRRRGAERTEAEDLTQGFFAHLLEMETLKKVDRRKGKFRTFLLSALTKYLSNEWDKRQTAKRGGGSRIISLDEAAAEHLYSLEPVEPGSPEKQFDRGWACALADRVLGVLRYSAL